MTPPSGYRPKHWCPFFSTYLILCKKKHDALVEITLSKEANIHAREYQLYLPDKELLRRKLAEWGEEMTE